MALAIGGLAPPTWDARDPSTYPAEGGDVLLGIPPRSIAPSHEVRQHFARFRLSQPLAFQLCRLGFTTAELISSLGENVLQVDRQIRGAAEGSGMPQVNPLIPLDPALGFYTADTREAEIAKLKGIWQISYASNKVHTDLLAQARHDMDARPIMVPTEEKAASIERFNIQYPDLGLSEYDVPAYRLWDDMNSQFTRDQIRFMRIGSIRFEVEHEEKPSKLEIEVKGVKNGVLEVEKAQDKSKDVQIRTVADGMIRLRCKFVLYALIGQLAIRVGLRYLKQFERWIREDKPTFETWLYAYEIIFKNVCRNLQFHRSLFPNFESAIAHEFEEIRLSATTNRAVVNGGRQTRDPLNLTNTDSRSNFDLDADTIRRTARPDGRVLRAPPEVRADGLETKSGKATRKKQNQRQRARDRKQAAQEDQNRGLGRGSRTDRPKGRGKGNKGKDNQRRDRSSTPPRRTGRSRTPPRRSDRPGRSTDWTPNSSKGSGKGGLARIPPTELRNLQGMNRTSRSGRTICLAFNSSVGCNVNSCNFDHSCAKCGGRHPAVEQHRSAVKNG